jgi:hypothetical protein
MLAARYRPLLCRAVPAVAVCCFLAWCFITLKLNFAYDDADSEILNQAWRLASGKSLYTDPNSPPFSFAIYPPLYFALVAFLLKFTGLSFLPAKLLSFLAALSIGWGMVRLHREWKAPGRDGLWAAFFLFLIPAFIYNAARCHVQMTAVALSVWSLVFFLRNRWPATLVLSPLLAVLAVYTKQSMMALPLAIVIYLAFRKPRWLLPYVLVSFIAGLIPLLWLQKITEGRFLTDTVYLARLSYDARQIPGIFMHHAGPLILFICLAACLAWGRFRANRWELVDVYFACVLLTTIASLGRTGAHGQYVVELLVVTLLFLLRTTGLPSMQGRNVLVAVQVLCLLVYAPLFVFLEEGPYGIASYRAAEKIYPIVREGSGPILSDQGSFPLFTRGEIYLQPFHFAGLTRAGLWDQNLLIREIDKRIFSWVIIGFDLENPRLSADNIERFTPEMIEALRKNYRRRETIYPYYLYRPRQ